ncbi:MAG: hypothetical protein HOH02_03775 [Oceanospirillaceae bacterium]|jgi:hypothetical protein|nr:hypothetical protein [Oceanospirillaceae bacterium]MBT4443633.1 hypothetical protein [Oceanospirillaceae bacterium]MBT6077066.1 hypothetical protein [Oceanospirillaceae bacterium]
MAIRTVHQVIGKNEQVIGEYMDLKLAKEMDNRTDVLYYLADLMADQGVDEQLAEHIAEQILNDQQRSEILNRLKSVKDLPTRSTAITADEE